MYRQGQAGSVAFSASIIHMNGMADACERTGRDDLALPVRREYPAIQLAVAERPDASAHRGAARPYSSPLPSHSSGAAVPRRHPKIA
jgi:hypothetical protein